MRSIANSVNAHIGAASGFGTLIDLSVAVMALVSGLFTARALGSDGRGELAAGTTLISLAFMIGNMGLHTSNSFFAARREIPDKVLLGNSLVGGSVFSVGTAALVFVITASLPAINGSAPKNLIAVGCLLFPAMFLDIYITYILIGKKLFVETGVLSFVSRAASLVAVVIVCLWSPSVMLVFLAMMLTVPIRLILTLVILKQKSLLTRVQPDWSCFKRSMSYALRVRGSEIFQFLNLRLDIFVLNYMTNAASLGVYSLGVFMSEFCWYPVNGLTRVLYPRLAERSSTEPEKSASQALLCCRFAFLITLILCVLVTLVGFLLIEPLFGRDFAGARVVLLLLLPGTSTYSISRVLTDSLAGLGLPHLGSLVAFSSLVVTIGLDLWLIPRHGINGAAIASSAAYVTSAIGASVIFARKTGTKAFEAFRIQRDEIALLVSVVPRAIIHGRNAVRVRQAQI